MSYCILPKLPLPDYMSDQDRRFLDSAAIAFFSACLDGKQDDSQYVKEQTYKIFLGMGGL